MVTLEIKNESRERLMVEEIDIVHRECNGGKVLARSGEHYYAFECSGCGKITTLAKTSDLLTRMSRSSLEGEKIIWILPNRMFARKLRISNSK